MLHSRPGGICRVAVLWKTMGTGEIAGIGAIGIITMK